MTNMQRQVARRFTYMRETVTVEKKLLANYKAHQSGKEGSLKLVEL